MADYKFPGDVEIGDVTLIGTAGQGISIKNLVGEINIYQNIFDHYLQCDIAVSDSLNLNSVFKGFVEERIPTGFNGGEKLIISYRESVDASKNSEVPWKKHMFALYELSDKSRINEFTESYILSGISLEAYQTIPQKISKSYGGNGGNTISNMMNSIIEEYVYNNTLKDVYSAAKIQKSVTVDETSGLQRYVIPSLTVDDTIDFLANESDSADHYPYYVFYEDSNGFNFRNVPDLIKNPTKIPTYFYFMSNMVESKLDASGDDQYKITSYNISKTTNVLTNIKGGLFKSKTINLDILKKKNKEVIFDYTKEVDNFQKLQGGIVLGEVSGDPVITLTTSRNGHDSDSNFQKENPLPKRVNSIYHRKKSFQRQIFNNVMEVTIPGNSSLNVGGLIFLIFHTHNDIDTDHNQIDKYLTGRYLITKVRQKINDNVFTTVLECSKDVGLI
jgi:hypothetical protein